jgi:HAD superfamily hydrolase (TIGR01509 family)
MDGTLVDTEPYWIEREHELVAQHGNGRWTDAHAHALVGFDLRDAARYIARHGEVDLPVDDIVNLMLDGVIDRVNRFIPWRPGARELLADLQLAGVPCALVTMSWRRFVEPVLRALPADSFPTLVCGDEVAHGKPHPEPYLRAAELLGLAPEDTLAIEDSPTGATSAEAAGCLVLVVPNHVPVPDGERRIVRDTLVGLAPDDLAAFFGTGS